MKTEFTPYQTEVAEIIKLLNHLRQHLEEELQNYLPGVKISLHARNIVILAPAEPNSRAFFTDEKGREYIITTTGAVETEPHPDNWTISVSYKTIKKQTI